MTIYEHKDTNSKKMQIPSSPAGDSHGASPTDSSARNTTGGSVIPTMSASLAPEIGASTTSGSLALAFCTTDKNELEKNKTGKNQYLSGPGKHNVQYYNVALTSHARMLQIAGITNKSWDNALPRPTSRGDLKHEPGRQSKRW